MKIMIYRDGNISVYEYDIFALDNLFSVDNTLRRYYVMDEPGSMQLTD